MIILRKIRHRYASVSVSVYIIISLLYWIDIWSMGPTWVKFVRMAPSGCWVPTERVAWSWWYIGTPRSGLVQPTAQIQLGLGLFEVIPPYVLCIIQMQNAHIGACLLSIGYRPSKGALMGIWNARGSVVIHKGNPVSPISHGPRVLYV